MPTLAQRLRAVEAALEGRGRFLDLRLDLTSPTGEVLLASGGRWDRLTHRYLDPATEGDVDELVSLPMQDSQLEFVRWFAEWLCAFRDGFPRDTTLAMLAGDRRGGKTFACNTAVISACIDCPIASDGTPLIAWIVSKSFRERFELEQWVLNRIPPAWYHHQAAPEHVFHFVNGATLRLLSADDPDSLKQGRVDICFVNEPQKVQARAIANAVLGSADLGGLTLLAANPPNNTRGEWMFDLKDAIDDEVVAAAKGTPHEPLGVRYFHVDSKKNKAIDQMARRRAGRVATIIDPSLAAGDVEGAWRRPDERACYEFDKHKHLHALPEIGGLPDVTAKVTRAAGLGEWPNVAGTDFQDKPHIVSTLWRCYGDPDDPTFWAFGELAGERRWTEEEYLDAFEAEFPALDRRSLLFIGDASGSWQDGPHNKGRNSFVCWKDRGWRMIPPQDPKSDKPDARARNPFVDDQLQVVNELLRRDRLRIDPTRAPWLSECFREAITKRDTGRRKIVQTRHAHALAASLYALWRLAGKRKPTPPPGPGSVKPIPRAPNRFRTF